MDGDDEWGSFVKEFTAFDLEDGGQRKIAWFDLRRDGLKAAGKEPTTRHRKGPSREKPSVASEDREIKETTSSMLDDIFHNVLKPQKSKDAFISAFRQEFETEHNGTPEQPKRTEPGEIPHRKPVKRTGPKRALEMTSDSMAEWSSVRTKERLSCVQTNVIVTRNYRKLILNSGPNARGDMLMAQQRAAVNLQQRN